MVGPANALNIPDLGVIYMDSDGIFENIPQASSSGQVFTSGAPGTPPSWAANVLVNPVVVVSVGGSQPIVANQIYLITTEDPVEFTLPASAPVGSYFGIIGKPEGGGWVLNQNSGQQLWVGSSSTSVGEAGSVESKDSSDSINFYCSLANLSWVCFGAPQSTGLEIS
jgi:hypothetical protein